MLDLREQKAQRQKGGRLARARGGGGGELEAGQKGFGVLCDKEGERILKFSLIPHFFLTLLVTCGEAAQVDGSSLESLHWSCDIYKLQKTITGTNCVRGDLLFSISLLFSMSQVYTVIAFLFFPSIIRGERQREKEGQVLSKG